jgi:hypothetical protein
MTDDKKASFSFTENFRLKKYFDTAKKINAEAQAVLHKGDTRVTILFPN